MGRNRMPLDGQVFSRMTVGTYSHSRQGQTYWNCICSCGAEKVCTRRSLVSGGTKSCGCFTKERILKLNSGRPAKLPEYHAVYRAYISGANKRKLTFNLSEQDFFYITQQNCDYCGRPPSNRNYRNKKGPFVYNGVDRLDNARGYTTENCVPCCKICNWAKNTMSRTDFLLYLDDLVAFRTGKR